MGVHSAIARIEVKRDADVIRRGTACLVGQNLVLTALHLVADRTTVPPQFLHGEIELRFPGHQPVRATVIEGKWDPLADWVLLACTDLLPKIIRPLTLVTLDRDGVEWSTHGFPDAEPGGLTVRGTVTDRHGTDSATSIPVYQLYCQEAAAGAGLHAKGLSGAPVIVRDAVAGVIRRAPLRDDRNEAGTLFACPASLIAAHCPEYFPAPLAGVSSASSTRHRSATDTALAAVKRSAVMFMGGLVLVLLLRYAYWAAYDEVPTSQDTMVFVVFAGVVVLAASLWVTRRGQR
jgi:Trypsin